MHLMVIGGSGMSGHYYADMSVRKGSKREWFRCDDNKKPAPIGAPYLCPEDYDKQHTPIVLAYTTPLTISS